MDKYYENLKKRHLVLTEKDYLGYGSDNNIASDGTTNQIGPYNRYEDGPHQWDHKLGRYRTYEEQRAYRRWLLSIQTR